MGAFIDLTGKKFGRLVVLRRSGYVNNHITWECKCQCGIIKIIDGSCLKNNSSKSCGCYKSEVTVKRNTTHGFSKINEYSIWTVIINRCYNKNDPYYNTYGGAGIKMSYEWRNSFVAFFNDMGVRPSKLHSVERRNNKKGYSKFNCYWGTAGEQARNKNNNVVVVLNGEKKCLKDWCIFYGINISTVSSRRKRGWSWLKSFEEPPKKYNKKP